MNLAKVSSNGQITVPVDIRRKLNIKEGDKIIFLEKPNGEIVLQNSSLFAIQQAQGKLDDIQLSEDEIKRRFPRPYPPVSCDLTALPI